MVKQNKKRVRLIRNCGSCAACCTLMGVEELQKPMGELCVHSTGSSCSIYETRPLSCRSFVCLWLDEATWDHASKPHIFWETERPDLCGVMFHPAGEDFMNTTGIPVMVARGDFQKGQAVLNRVAKFTLLVLIHDDGRRQLMGSPEAIEAVRNYSWHEVKL